MLTVPNQKVISIKKEKCNKESLYTTNNLIALDEAASKLTSKGGFKLYIYLAKNQNNYQLALSSSDFCKWGNLGMTAYRTAIQELIEKGFLVEMNTNSNQYIFYDKPTKANKILSNSNSNQQNSFSF